MLPSFPQRSQPGGQVFELPDASGAPKWLTDWISKIQFSKQYVKWFGLIDSNSIGFKNVSVVDQAAAIAATAFGNTGSAGAYRLTYYLVNTVGDPAAGTIQLSVVFTDDAGATSVIGAAVSLTGGGLRRTSDVVSVRLASGNVTWQTALAGAIGNARYSLFMTMEQLQ